MTDSTRSDLDDRINRYVRRELSAEESRKLAQESLDSPELFDELTYSALAKTAVSGEPVPGGNVVRFPRRTRFAAAGAVAAAAVVLIALNLRPAFFPQDHPRRTAAVPHPKPALVSSSDPAQPILLADGLRPGPSEAGSPAFRGPESTSRSPRPSGAIVSIEDGLAAIDLGSVDGLANGSELQVFRDEQSKQPIGHLLVTAVFRERARGRILEGQKIQAHNQVRVSGADHLTALLEQVDALSSQGDSDAARKMAETAARWAETAGIKPGQRRKALQRLAALEYQAGSLQSAEMHYRAVVESLNGEPAATAGEQALAFNNLAVLRLLTGDYDGAEGPLSQAVSKSPKTDIVYARSLNNLAVLAELRGDRPKAESLYADAQRALGAVADSPAQEHRALETNLARIRGSQ